MGTLPAVYISAHNYDIVPVPSIAVQKIAEYLHNTGFILASIVRQGCKGRRGGAFTFLSFTFKLLAKFLYTAL